MSENPLAHPAVFRRVVVEPNVQALAERSDDIRLAMNAVFAVDALVAHIFWWVKEHAPQSDLRGMRDDSEYRHHLSKRSEYFGVLRDLAKALKHVQLSRHDPKVAGANKMGAMPVGYGELPYGRGRFGGPTQVVVQLSDDSYDYVESIISDAMAVLAEQMRCYGCEQEPI